MFYVPNNLNEVREGTDDDSSIEEIVDDDVVDEAEEVGDDENPNIESENSDIESENLDVNGTESDDEGGWQPNTCTYTFRTNNEVACTPYLIQEQGALGFSCAEAVGHLKLSNQESNYCAALMNLSCAETDEHEMEAVDKIHLQEYAYVGAGIGGGFQNTKELHVMKYKKAMRSPDKEEWDKAVDGKNMQKYGVWTPVALQDLPPGTKILTTTWAMKKKAN